MKKTIILTILFFTLGIVKAQKNDIAEYVDSLNVYFNHYSDELRSFRLAVIASDELSTLQKYDRYSQGKKNLMEDFKNKRRAEFDAISNLVLTVSHSCTKDYSGGTKKCGTECIKVPKGFVKISGTFKHSGVGVVEDANGACVSLQKSGKGRIEGKASAEYEIDKKYLNQLLDKEAIKLFGEITARHRQYYFNEEYENLF